MVFYLRVQVLCFSYWFYITCLVRNELQLHQGLFDTLGQFLGLFTNNISSSRPNIILVWGYDENETNAECL